MIAVVHPDEHCVLRGDIITVTIMINIIIIPSLSQLLSLVFLLSRRTLRLERGHSEGGYQGGPGERLLDHDGDNNDNDVEHDDDQHDDGDQHDGGDDDDYTDNSHN